MYLLYQKIFTQISDQYVVCGDFNAHHKLWGGKRNDTKGNHLYNHVIENNIVVLKCCVSFLYIIRNHVTTKFNITCTGKSLPVCIFIIPFETIILVTIYHGFIRNFRASHTGRGEDFKNYKEKEKLCKKLLHDTQQIYWENYCNSLNNNSNLSQVYINQFIG
jgi:hypothetical protein